ncbi:MAG: hypothetical protein QM764_14135 [Chitinophagaceae bacterium]
MNKATSPLPLIENIASNHGAIIIPINPEVKSSSKQKKKKMSVVKKESVAVTPQQSAFTSAVFHPKKHDLF